jgi:hypothetical protein
MTRSSPEECRSSLANGAGRRAFSAFEIFGRVRPVYFMPTPKVVYIVHRGDAQVRVYIDVAHSASPAPSWYGESVGRYDGDELVVDTIGLNDKTFIDNYRTLHTEQLQVVERFRLIDRGNILYVAVTVEDPGAFTTPWQAVQRFKRYDEGGFHESVCARLFPLHRRADSAHGHAGLLTGRGLRRAGSWAIR